MPNCLVCIFLSAYIIGVSVAAWLDSPEVDPGQRAGIVFPKGEGTKGGKMSDFVHNENVLGTHDL